jgi:hypothetical protein
LEDKSVFVVVWDSHRTSGHQAVRDPAQAEQISRVLYQRVPDAQVRVLTAEQHAAAVLADWQRQRRSLPR